MIINIINLLNLNIGLLMTSITKPASSTVWMASILDFSQNDKKNLESILNKDPANNKVNPQEQIHNQQEKPQKILSNKNQAQHNNDTLSLIDLLTRHYQ